MTHKERPILFSGPMVRAILKGRKTLPRRIAKEFNEMPNLDGILKRFPNQQGCPYGNPGDLLWVRETHRYWWPDWEDPGSHPCRCRYKADYAIIDLPVEWDEGNQFLTPEDAGLDEEPYKWRRSIHMPRWASRITLEITGVRVERLQEISEENAWEILVSDYLAIHWDANPWVWMVEFKRVQSGAVMTGRCGFGRW